MMMSAQVIKPNERYNNIVPNEFKSPAEVTNDLDGGTHIWDLQDQPKVDDGTREMVIEEETIEHGGIEATYEQVAVANNEVEGNNKFTLQEPYGYLSKKLTKIGVANLTPSTTTNVNKETWDASAQAI